MGIYTKRHLPCAYMYPVPFTDGENTCFRMKSVKVGKTLMLCCPAYITLER